MSDLRKVGVFVALSLAVLPGFAQQAPAQTTVTGAHPGSASATSVFKASAVVTAVDKSTRKVTLKTADGRSFDVLAGDEVKNFDQIKVNDEVVATYVRAITLAVKKNGGVRERTEGVDAARAKPGEKPGGAVGSHVTIVADVIDVNRDARTITLKGPKGRVVELDVKNPDHFKAVKKGDQVTVDYVEALAVNVEPAAAPAAK